ncbi:MAG: tyrosine-type recombinase/integrase [Angelakisella sp.]|nr:tyrosine-type recombinase/integrase [Angelakisella sp.]
MKKISMYNEEERTFQDGVEEYYKDCQIRNLRAGTLKHYRDGLNIIYKYIPSDTPISSFNENTIKELTLALKERNINDVSLKTYLRDFKTLLNFFMDCGYMRRFNIPLPKADKQPIESYTDDELKILLKKPNLKTTSFSEYKNWVIVNTLLSTGIRQNSLLNLKVKDIDFDNQVLYVNVTKNRKPLIVPLNCDIVAILREYLKYRKGNEEDYLFCNAYGQPLVKSTLYYGLYHYNKKRGVETTGIHRYRHTFAKKWIMMGGSVVTLQKMLGHSSLAITENYINILVTDLKRDVDRYNILSEFNKKAIKLER